MDFNKVVTLLKIIDLAKQWPTLQALHDAAMKELVKLNVDAAKELAEAAKAEAKAKAEADAKAAADARAKANTPEPRSVPSAAQRGQE